MDLFKNYSDFEIKILTAPGKRKDIDRQELAEDVAGFAYYNKYAIFWLVDGAPGPEIKHDNYFGSRILARYIGESFENASKQIIYKSIYTIDNKFGEEIFTEMKKILEKRLYEKIKNSLNYLEERAKELPINHSTNRYVLEWSASFIAAIVRLVSPRGLVLTAGDCIGVFGKGGGYKPINKRGRIFVQWSAPIGQIAKFEIKIIEEHAIEIENTDKVILMSDGVAPIADIEAALKNKDINTIEENAKKTDDDKTLIVFKILNKK